MAMPDLESDRVGRILRQPQDYDSYIPNKVFGVGIDLKYDSELIKLICESERYLGELIGVTETVPNPDLFIAFYVQKEALLSSQIEGTQCSLDEVLTVEDDVPEVKPVHEVVNYIKAMNHGLGALESLPISLRLINDIHKILLSGVRGKEKCPGEFKKTQNWVGPAGCELSEARYIPPPPHLMLELMGDWEKYYHSEKEVAPLVEAAILHSYFETIHPYIDGNGRLGRLLITFMLCERKILSKPLLYLSLFFKEHKSDYYQLLMDVRFKGQWEEWIKFFLRGVRNTSQEAIKTATEIKNLIEKHKNLIDEKLYRYHLAPPVYKLICQRPLLTIAQASEELNANYQTVKKVFDYFIENGLLKYRGEPNRKRNKFYIYEDYVEILRRGT